MKTSLNWNQEIEENDKTLQNELMSSGKLPKHVAIIMDGNGRWAKNKLIPRLSGHREGIESVRDIVKASSQLGINYLSLYAFSIENWNRPSKEVNGLMKLLENFIKSEIDELHNNNVKLNAIGKLSSLPNEVNKILRNAIEKTKDNDGLVLTLCLSYGSRWDIVRSVQMIALDVRRGNLSPEDINEDLFSSYLQTAELPDPDLLIRTSGEMRISNYMLWEMAYGEIYISDVLWPQFRRLEFYKAIYNYLNRERRFGKISEQLDSESGNNATTKNSYLQRVLNAVKNS